MSIDRRFYVELFESKDVQLHSKNYKELYNSIWLCESLFKDFLTSYDSSLKICYAKKIYTYIQAFNDVSIPDYYVKNIIYYQQHELIDNTESYIPQDHIIHSVNLYILGVYLFFNFPAFHIKLLGIPRPDVDLNKRILSFIKKWRNFSFYHDIGYSLEAIVDKNGKIKKQYSSIEVSNLRIFNDMQYLYTLRNVSRLITDVSWAQIKGTNFNIFELFDNFHCIWVKNDLKVIKNTEIKNDLSNFKDTIILNGVFTYYGYNNLLSLIGNDKYLVLIFDELEIPIGLLVKQGNKICDYYLKKNYTLDIIKTNYQKYNFRYSIKQIDNYLKSFIDYNPTRIKGFYYYLPSKFKSNLDFISNDQQINEFVFDIYNWLLSQTNNSVLEDFEEKYKANLANYYRKSIASCICNKLNLNDTCNNSIINDLQSVLNEIFINFQDPKVIEKLIEEIKNKAINNYYNDNGIYYDIINHCKNTYQAINQLLEREKLNNLNFIEKNKNQINLKIFSHSSNKLFEENLFRKILSKCKSFGINFESILSYKTNYTHCDHGLVSAGIFYQATVFSNYLAEYCKKNPNLLLSWKINDSSNLFNDETINEYADVIFSILLHNIYTKKSNKKYGIEYTQNIEIDPFSYFCSFCDTLQKWKRPKQIDFSKTNLPIHHYLNDDFDLIVSNDKITIVCDNNDVKSVKENIIKEETFLTGISNIIHIKGNDV